MEQTQTTDKYSWKNPEYEQLANNLPEFQYTKGWGDKLGEWLGMKTESTKAADEFANYNENYLAQLRQLDQETWYNNAINQAQRMEAAGQNVDLKGGIEPGEAGEFDNQANNPPSAENTPDIIAIGKAIKETSSFMGMLATGISTAMAAVNTMSGLEIADAGLRTDIVNEVGNLVKGHWGLDPNSNQIYLRSPYWSTERWVENENGDGSYELAPIGIAEMTWETFKNNAEVKKKWHSRRQQKYAYQAFKDIMGSLDTDTEAKNSWIANYKANEGLGEQMENPTAQSITAARDFYKDIEPQLKEIQKLETKLMNDYYKRLGINDAGNKKANAETSGYNYNYNYYSNAKGSYRADYENEYYGKQSKYWGDWQPEKEMQLRNSKNQAGLEDITVTMELNRLYNAMIKEEIRKICNLQNPAAIMFHATFLQSLQSGKAGNQSFLNGMNTLNGMGNSMFNTGINFGESMRF